ncbi:hypothetical protein C8Q75DRAFT_802638 [Abortiporus biennis]|nr:hypothetical protein C8Q75DRAFT_802638 [Abortiporus biennis]
MPAPITTNGRKTVKTNGKITTHAPNKKTRIVRRRGRGKNGVGSDDEIEREARTDSDTDDDQSSLLSDSDTESVSDDDHPTNGSEVVTPSTTQSPPPLDFTGPSSSSKGAPLTTTLVNGDAGPFVGATDWAQMVADENANGASDLPVIDFAEMDRHAISQPVVAVSRSRKQSKAAKKAANGHTPPKVASISTVQAPPPPKVDDEEPPVEEEPVASTSRQVSRERRPPKVAGTTARQAYQQRLESDPSYVPKVGEFWGHDERLLEKGLRSLSPWWRGRWQTRGGSRGRVGFSMRGRGRGFAPPNGHAVTAQEQPDVDGASPATEVPPIERAWTHDGFEEMKRREERRKAQVQQQSPSFGPSQRGMPFRGRGGFFSGRGRGGFVRGGAVASPTSSRGGLPFGPSSGRPWFAMKPEKPWTKQHEGFLYFNDAALKPRLGLGAGIRIRLPGGRREQVIRTPPRVVPSSTIDALATTTSGPTTDDTERSFTVRIPRREDQQQSVAGEKETVQVEEPATTVAELSIDEVFTVRPHAVPSHVPIGLPHRADASPEEPESTEVDEAGPSTIHTSYPAFTPSPSASSAVPPVSLNSAHQQLEQILVPSSATIEGPSAHIENTVLRNPPSNIHAPIPQVVDESRHAPLILPPLQTTFSPIPPTSPPYGSPYAYAPAMPPGIAMSQQGYPYEIATGRPVYLQATPPPPMFTPRPMMHMSHPSGGVPFMPSHMHHPSITSPDFLAPSSTPPVNGFIDPSTGLPIFTPARQSSRIEIKAPDGKKAMWQSRLRTEVAETPSMNTSAPSFYPPDSSDSNTVDDNVVPGGETAVSGQPQAQYSAVEPNMMAYAPYQQQYYYPGQYGYAPYMDMSSQAMNYELYSTEHNNQPIIYY